MPDTVFDGLVLHGLGVRDRPIVEASLERDVKYLVKHAHDERNKRLTLAKLNSGLRNVDEIIEEALLTELMLKLAISVPDKNGVLGRLLKICWKVEVDVFAPGYRLREHWRKYLRRIGRDRKPMCVLTRRTKGVRGTMKRGRWDPNDPNVAIQMPETPLQAAIREIREELELELGRDYEYANLKPSKSPLLGFNPFDTKNWRESEVYCGLVSVDVPHRYELHLPERPWLHKDTPPDRDVVVRFQWESHKSQQDAKPEPKQLDTMVRKLFG